MGDSHTLIDNIFSSVAGSSNVSGNICYSISDHLPQFCIFSTYENSSITGEKVNTNWSKFDQENFILDYLNIDWDCTFDECGLDPDLCFNIFDSKIKGLLDLHLPTVRLTKRQLKTQLKPWITPGIIKSMYIRDSYFRKFIKAKCPETQSKF